MTILTSGIRASHAGRARPAALLLFSLLFSGWAWGAGPSFEIELSELDKSAPAAKKIPAQSGKAVKKVAPKKRIDPGPATSQDMEGEFVNYTIRPGDHIYKVLTSRFGLSSARAEALIPRILRVNGIRDIRGLQIGRTIRIPVAGKMSAAPAPKVPATPAPDGAAVPAPAAADTPVPAVSAPSTATVLIPSPPPAAEASVLPVPSPPPKASKVIVRTIPPGAATDIADALLDALSLEWSKTRLVAIPVGGSGGASLAIPVERYFEDGGKRCFLDFSEGDADRATLARLLEVDGYRRIAVGGKDDFRTIAGKILKAVEIPAEYRMYSLAPVSGGPGALEIQGYLVLREERAGERIFLTDMPVEKPVYDLIHTGEWDIQ